MNMDTREKFAEILKNCSEEYSKNAKGASNLAVLKELLKKLFLQIFLRFREVSTCDYQ